MPNFKSTEDFLKDISSTVEKEKPVVKTEEEVEVELNEQQDVSEEIEDGAIELEEGSEEEPEKEEVTEDDLEGREKVIDEDEGSEDGIVFADDEPEVVEEVDYSKLATELGFEGVKNKEQLLQKYKSDLEKAKEDALSGLPENLKEAINFAKEGGDFMAVLEVGSIDYDKVSNLELVEAKYNRYFLDEEGKFDKESFDDWVAQEGKAKINMLADQIREQEKTFQKAKIDSIRLKAKAEQDRLNAELKTELSRIDSIGGVKLTQAQKDKMYDDTVSGIAMEELFYEGGKISNKKLAENLFKVRMFEKAIHIAKTSSKNEGKREVISKATNASVQRRAERPQAEVKKMSPMDQFFEHIKNKK